MEFPTTPTHTGIHACMHACKSTHPRITNTFYLIDPWDGEGPQRELGLHKGNEDMTYMVSTQYDC